MTTPLVLGIDPGFAAFGYAVAEVVTTGHGIRVLELDVIRTAKSTAKRNVRTTDDNVRRAREIALHINAVLDGYAPPFIAVCAEAMSFPRSSSVAAKVALAWGVVAGICEARLLPLLQCTPQELKQAVCGRKTASKEDVELALKERYGADVIDDHVVGLGKLREHPIDALGAIHACLNTNEIRMARRFVA